MKFSSRTPTRWDITTWMIAGLALAAGISIYTTAFSSPSWQSQGIPGPAARVFASHAINNTVVIVPVNLGMMYLADNLLCSLSRTSFNTSNVLFWALDVGAQVALQAKGFDAYHDPSLFSTTNNENSAGVTKSYKRMMLDRPKFFIDVLSSGFDLLMLDADTVFWQSPLSVVPDSADYDKVDVVYSTDGRDFYQTHNAFEDPRRRGERMPPICNGIFWMKSSPKTIALWTEMLKIFQSPWPLGPIRRIRFQDDQRGMDVLLNDGRARIVKPLPGGITEDFLPKVRDTRRTVSVRLLDQTRYANGYLLQNRRETYESNLADLRRRGDDRVAAHFNWNAKIISKEAGASAMQMWFLDDRRECKLED